MKSISIVIPVCNEEKNVRPLIEELKRVTKPLSYDFTLIFVDDGSSDNSLETIREEAKTDSSILCIELSRNFGKEIAISAGVDHVTTDACVIIDSDLQHPPSVITELISKWEAGFEVIVATRTSTLKKAFFRRIGSHLFHKILNAISEIPVDLGSTDFRLLDRMVVDALKKMPERNRIMRGLIDWMGFRRAAVPFEAPARTDGKPGYTYKKLFGLAINAFTSSSLFPLRLAGYIGLLITVTFGGLIVLMTVDKFWEDKIGVTNRAFIIVANSFFSGIVMMCLGLIALYIGNIHSEVSGRPLYIVRSTYGRNKKSKAKKSGTR